MLRLLLMKKLGLLPEEVEQAFDGKPVEKEISAILQYRPSDRKPIERPIDKELEVILECQLPYPDDGQNRLMRIYRFLLGLSGETNR